jgi:nitrate reductase alpha subunit
MFTNMNRANYLPTAAPPKKQRKPRTAMRISKLKRTRVRWICASTYTDQQTKKVIDCWFAFTASSRRRSRIWFAQDFLGTPFHDSKNYSELGKNRADTIQWHPHLMEGWARSVLVVFFLLS